MANSLRYFPLIPPDRRSLSLNMIPTEPTEEEPDQSRESKGKYPAAGENERPSSLQPAYEQDDKHPVSYPRYWNKTRPRLSQNTFVRPEPRPGGGIPRSHTLMDLAFAARNSNTWTSSSVDLDLVGPDEEDERLDWRERFVQEYSRLARQNGIRPMVAGGYRNIEDTTKRDASQSRPERRGRWLSRFFHRSPSAGQPQQFQQVAALEMAQLPHRRSISDLALNLVHPHLRKDDLKNEDLRGLVRLCGRSKFYLPAEYAPGSLILPTCFRATAQVIVQNAETRGIFRIHGSVRTANALYDYYCAIGENKDEIASTTRCPTLPSHLNCSVHDVATVFKRLLAGLPGGILGSLSLFDALVAIHTQLQSDPESIRTKETSLRGRLIALAIGTVASQYQRELICAVFGMLCLVGREAETAPREDDKGRPLPTSDLMGYGALATIFAPLLVNDLINSYRMNIADPAAGLVILPVRPPKQPSSPCKKQRQQSRSPETATLTSKPLSSMYVANGVAEMLIVNWREIVKHLRSLEALRPRKEKHFLVDQTNRQRGRARDIELKNSASDFFDLQTPSGWNAYKRFDLQTPSGWDSYKKNEEAEASNFQVRYRSASPTERRRMSSPEPSLRPPRSRNGDITAETPPSKVRRSRPPSSSSASFVHGVQEKGSIGALSPTIEESPATAARIGNLSPSHVRCAALDRVPSEHPSFAVSSEDRGSITVTKNENDLEIPAVCAKVGYESAKSESSIPSEERKNNKRIDTNDDDYNDAGNEEVSNTDNTGDPERAVPGRPSIINESSAEARKQPRTVTPDIVSSECLSPTAKSTKQKTTPQSTGFSNAGHTPLQYNKLFSSHNFLHKPRTSSSDDGDLASSPPPPPPPHQCTPRSQKRYNPRRLLSRSDSSFTRGRNYLYPIQSEGDRSSSTSAPEKFLSFHPSFVEASSETPNFDGYPLPAIERLAHADGAHNEASLGNKFQPETTTSAWSLKNILLMKKSPDLKKGPKTPEKASDGITESETQQRRKGSNKTSASSLWKTLISPSPSIASLKERKKSRSGVDASTNTPQRSDEVLGPPEHSQPNANLMSSAKEKKTPDWKRQILERRAKKKDIAIPFFSSGKKVGYEGRSISDPVWRQDATRSASDKLKNEFGSSKITVSDSIGGRSSSQRSTSRPVSGTSSVKAMAAMFDSAMKESPEGRKVIFTGRAKGDLISISSSKTQTHQETSKLESPVQSVKSAPATKTNGTQQQNTYVRDRVFKASSSDWGTAKQKGPAKLPETPKSGMCAVRRAFQPNSKQGSPLPKVYSGYYNRAASPYALDTPRTGLQSAYAGYKSQILPSRPQQQECSLSHATSLGTMVAHHEEPPIATHLALPRPPSAADSNYGLTEAGPSAHVHPPVGVGFGGTNSLLYAQIQMLQRQLELRTDEVKALRRQLETHQAMDVGTLSHQLRVAQCEARMWRERAEAAERRVAVFERFTARVRALGRERDFEHALKGVNGTEATVSREDGPSSLQDSLPDDYDMGSSGKESTMPVVMEYNQAEGTGLKRDYESGNAEDPQKNLTRIIDGSLCRTYAHPTGTRNESSEQCKNQTLRTVATSKPKRTREKGKSSQLENIQITDSSMGRPVDVMDTDMNIGRTGFPFPCPTRSSCGASVLGDNDGYGTQQSDATAQLWTLIEEMLGYVDGKAMNEGDYLA